MTSIHDVHKYWNDRPCNVRHSSLSPDTLEYFEAVSAKRYIAEPHIKEFISADTWKDKWVLDLGCGIGTDSIEFAKAGANVVCVDLTENAITLCKKNFELHGLRAKFFVGNIEQLDKVLPPEYLGQFDVVYSFGVIHHSPNPQNIIQHVPKYLNDSGEFRCMVYSKISYKLLWIMHEANEWQFEKSDRLIQYYSEAQTGCPVTYTYTFDDVRELVTPHLNVKKIWKDHIFIWDIDNYKNNQFVVDKAFKNINSEFLNDMKREIGWHTLFIGTPVR